MKLSHLAATTAAVAMVATSATAMGCSAGKTITEGTLTIATGNPAYFPWVMDDAPESKAGFEAVVAYAVANEMGFADDQVTWVRTGFDEAIQPGAKNFDFNLQQFSITADRDEMVDFSAPYYSAASAVLCVECSADSDLKSLKWGAAAGTTAGGMIEELIGPNSSVLLYNDSADVTAAMQAGQIDASLFDLPTALYLGAVVLDNGSVLGQFAADKSENPDQFGFLMAEGNPLKECVDEAIGSLTASGALAAIEAEWLQETTGVPVIE